MGGGEINVLSLAKGLAERDHTVTVITSAQKGLLSYERVAGIQVHRLLNTGNSAAGIKSNIIRSSLFPRSLAKELPPFLEKNQVDVIHFIGTSIIAAKKIKKIGIPLVATIESYPALCPKGDRMFNGQSECAIVCSYLKFLSCQQKSAEIGKTKNKFYLKYNPAALSYIYNFYAKLNAALQDCKLIAISKYVQELLEQQNRHSTVIPNSVDISAFAGPTPQENQNVKILYLGSLTTFKGPQILVEALNGLPYRCEIYGEGNLKSELQQRISEYKLNAQIFPLIPPSQVASLYLKADIIVFPSIWPEPFGRIAIEAMAAGKAIIASNIGGIKETLQYGGGVLVQPGDILELRAKIKELAENSTRRQELGNQGKLIVQQHYATEVVIERLENFYKTIILKAEKKD